MEDHSVRAQDSPGRRAASYWHIDGLPEIVSGVAFALLGGLGLCSHWVRSLPWFERGATLAVMLLLLTVLFAWDRRIAQYIKARVTYPRTGYVPAPAPSNEARRREVVIGLGLRRQPPPDENVTAFHERTVVVLIAGGWAVSLVNRPWGLPLMMSAAALALYVLNRHSWWSTLFPPAAAFLCLLLDVSGPLQRALVYVIGGVWLLAQGTWTLCRYLRKNPRPPAIEGLHA
jgi:hypothetical protein